MKRISIVFLLALSLCNCAVIDQVNEKPNVLFITIDDLRTELGCYDSPIAQSPNIDLLAENGMLFNRAYCQQAICGPSRASVLTGLRPSNSRITHNYLKFRDALPDVQTLSQYFGSNGYRTAYIGKIFHQGDNDSASWNSEVLIDSAARQNKLLVSGFALDENKKIRNETRKEMFAKYGEVARYGLAMGPAYECADVADNRYADGLNTDIAITTLADMSEAGDPFFMAVGYHKPHLNWVAPKKYWDLFDRNDIPLSTQNERPVSSTALALHPSFELRVRSGIPKYGPFDTTLSRTLLHSYLACVSYVDAQVGRLVKTLEELGELDNTIIVLWSDHGFHLGEMGVWGKASNYEIATRVPFIFCFPGMAKESIGRTSDALVELVDIYPTLCDLAGINIPVHLDGESLKPLLMGEMGDVKSAAYSQFPVPALREWGAYPLRPAMRETYFGPLIEDMEDRIEEEFEENWNQELFENNVMGYAMRTDQYRLIVWIDESGAIENPLAIELFDHGTDPNETMNVAESKQAIVDSLMIQLKKDLSLNF